MSAKKEFKVYLAGPEVFLPDPIAKGADKYATIERFNHEVLPDKNFRFVGLYPMDAQIDVQIDEYEETPATAMRIFHADVDLMDKADLIIANITRFRGPSADVGTAFEMGYMYAQQKPVFVYYNMQETYFTSDQIETTVLDCASPDSDAHTTYAEKVHAFAAGYLVDHSTTKDHDNYTHMIENFGLADNLMLIGAAKTTTGKEQGYAPATSFWKALHEATASIEAKDKNASTPYPR